jgi:uncharacterized membrane protein
VSEAFSMDAPMDASLILRERRARRERLELIHDLRCVMEAEASRGGPRSAMKPTLDEQERQPMDWSAQETRRRQERERFNGREP